MIRRLFLSPFLIRLLHWEYWPFHVVYGLIYPYWIYLCLRSGSFFWFNSGNPSIKNGGFLMESKFSIYNLIPEKYYPTTVFISRTDSPDICLEKMNEAGLKFPIISKPDIGMKGIAVKRLNNKEELAAHLASIKVDMLLQEIVWFPKEAGIFYYRIPGEQSGSISGIVYKEFLTVTGDGVSNVTQLLKNDSRGILQLSSLKENEPQLLMKVPQKGEQVTVVPFGNHVRGARFIDASHEKDESLVKVIDKVCSEIRGFYYGRLDVRFNNWEELKRGENFSIIEVNGAGSEPAHIYDPSHSIFFAWREIIRHWKILWTISRLNRKGTPHMTFREGLKMFRDNSRYLKTLKH